MIFHRLADSVNKSNFNLSLETTFFFSLFPHTRQKMYQYSIWRSFGTYSVALQFSSRKSGNKHDLIIPLNCYNSTNLRALENKLNIWSRILLKRSRPLSRLLSFQTALCLIIIRNSFFISQPHLLGTADCTNSLYRTFKRNLGLLKPKTAQFSLYKMPHSFGASRDVAQRRKSRRACVRID